MNFDRETLSGRVTRTRRCRSQNWWPRGDSAVIAHVASLDQSAPRSAETSATSTRVVRPHGVRIETPRGSGTAVNRTSRAR